jgi:hypothetical protein
LRNIFRDPGALHRMAVVRREAFDGRDLRAVERADRHSAGRIGLPSICTVQTPHCAIPQPNFVPVKPTTSRKTQSSGVSGSILICRDVPLTSIVITASLLRAMAINRGQACPVPRDLGLFVGSFFARVGKVVEMNINAAFPALVSLMIGAGGRHFMGRLSRPSKVVISIARCISIRPFEATLFFSRDRRYRGSETS